MLDERASKFEGKDAFVWGFAAAAAVRAEVTAGRWYTPAEAASRARVAVIATNLARITGTHVGDTRHLKTAAGPASFRVIGITSSQWNNGHQLLRAAATLRRRSAHRRPSTATSSARRAADHAAIDRTTTRLEDRLDRPGYAVGDDGQVLDASRTTSTRTARSARRSPSSDCSSSRSAWSASINAITMSVLERTREIGVLRCIGARARDIRRIFTAEGHRRRARRLAARDPGRLRARPPVQLADAEGRRDRVRLHLPAAQPR